MQKIQNALELIGKVAKLISNFRYAEIPNAMVGSNGQIDVEIFPFENHFQRGNM